MSGRRSRSPTPVPILRNSSEKERSSTSRRLVEHAPNQPYLVAPGKPTVQKLPDFKMTSSKILNDLLSKSPMLARAHRTLADRGLLHHQPRRQDRGGDGGGGSQPSAATPGAANACPIRAMARPRRRRWPPCRRCRSRSSAGSTARPCRPRCRPAPPATRWIARCWTSRPRPAAGASGTCSDVPPPRPASPPIRSRWPRPRRWRRRPPRPRTGRC